MFSPLTFFLYIFLVYSAFVMHLKTNLLSLQIALVIALFPVGAYAAISNGVAAIDGLGQYDDSLTDPQPIYTKNTVNNGPNKLGLNQPFSSVIIDTVRNRLFVPECANNRVLVYDLNTDGTLVDHIPDYVLGQATFYENAAATTQSGMRCPIGGTYDAEREYVFISDHSNSRILVFDVASITNGENASYVLGQSSFTSSGTSISQASLFNPWQLDYSSTGSRLFVADRDNNRVLMYETSSLSNGMNASTVLGQSTFTGSTATATQTGMSAPRGVTFDYVAQRLFVVDTGSNRVLVFTGSSLTNGMSATHLLGQTSYSGTASATTQAGLNAPQNAAYAASGSRLFIADASNRRVIIYDIATIANGESAENVLGKTNFTTNTAQVTQSGLNTTYGVTFDNASQHLFASDAGNNRIMVFHAATVNDGEDAIDAIGQYDDSLSDPQPVYTKSSANDAPNRFGLSLNSVASSQPVVDEVNHRLFVADTFNNRVLVYNLNTNNELEDRIPDYVLGQPNFYTNAGANTQAGMSQPNGLAYDSDNQRLFVISPSHSRILVYDVTSITNGENAAYVLGQSSFTAGSASLTSAGMSFGRGVAFDQTNQRLFVADTGYNRVIVYVFTGGTITTGMSGSYVLGQASFTTSSTGLTASTFNNPYALAYDDNNQRLFVADNGNSRIMVFDVSSITNGEDAVYVIGKSDFTSAVNAQDAVTLVGTRGVAYDPDYQRLFVTNIAYNRVMVFDVSTITNGEAATHVLGQSDFTTITAATTQSGLTNPQGATYVRSSKQLFVADRGNNRLIVFDVAPPTTASSSSTSSEATRSPSGGGRRGSPGRGGIAPEIDTSDWRVVDAFLENSAGDEESSTNGNTSSATLFFRDVPASAWFLSAVEDLVSRKILSGYADASGKPLHLFGPSDPVTVGQILKIALLATGHELPVPAGVPSNRTATDWSAPYVALAESLKLTLASDNVTRPATRGQVIRLLMEAADIDVSAATANQFSDLNLSDPNTPYILKATELGIVTGDTRADGSSAGTVRPDDTINRAETAALVMRLITLLGL